MKRIIKILVVIFFALLPVIAAAQGKPDRLLPNEFAGWQRVVPSESSTQPAAADPVYSDVLKEYGFSNYEAASYTRGDRKIAVKAIRFKDATGAYGAFTFYKTPEMQTEKIGDQASSDNRRVLFYRGSVLVQAVLDHVTPMSAAELRDLASEIALPSGTARNLPAVPLYLPRQAYVPNSAKYVIGPVGLADINAPVNAQQVDFSVGAEVALAQYSSDGGSGTVTLISYPTPQIAAERLHAIEVSHPQQDNAPLFLTRRSGPLIAIATGAMSPRQAKSLLASVNYDPEVTWNQNTFLGKRDNVGTLLVGVVVLTGVILGMALVAGIAFGGFRILVKRLFPDRVFDRSRDVEIIELKLR